MVASPVLGTQHALVKNCEIEQNRKDREGTQAAVTRLSNKRSPCAYFSLSTIPGIGDIIWTQTSFSGKKSNQKEEIDVQQLG